MLLSVGVGANIFIVIIIGYSYHPFIICPLWSVFCSVNQNIFKQCYCMQYCSGILFLNESFLIKLIEWMIQWLTYKDSLLVSFQCFEQIRWVTDLTTRSFRWVNQHFECFGSVNKSLTKWINQSLLKKTVTCHHRKIHCKIPITNLYHMANQNGESLCTIM